jgi:hypothetical protein
LKFRGYLITLTADQHIFKKGYNMNICRQAADVHFGALRRNQVLDRTPHTDQSNWRLLDRRTAPVSTALACNRDLRN